MRKVVGYASVAIADLGSLRLILPVDSNILNGLTDLNGGNHTSLVARAPSYSRANAARTEYRAEFDLPFLLC